MPYPRRTPSAPLSATQVATLEHVTQRSVLTWLYTGKLRGRRLGNVGSRWRIDPRDYRLFVLRRAAKRART